MLLELGDSREKERGRERKRERADEDAVLEIVWTANDLRSSELQMIWTEPGALKVKEAG